MGAAQQIAFTLEKTPIYNHDTKMLARYSKFRDGADFNNQWEMIMVDYKKNFTAHQLDALRIVRQYAVSVAGVCNASYNTLMDRAKDVYGYEISRDTFRTAINKCEKFGILIKFDGMRMIKGRGSRTANVVIFNRYEEVTAFQIAQQKKQAEEIEQLLQEEYEKVSPVVNFAHNARKWHEQKAENKRKKEEYEARKQREKQEREAAAKRQQLFFKMLAALKAKKLDTTIINEYSAIMYNAINKALVADNRITKQQAEEIALKQFYLMCETPNNEIKKNRPAFLSHLLRSNLIAIAKGYTSTQLAQKQAQAKGKYVEKAPDWFESRNREKQADKDSSLIDFEAEQKKFLEKLGK